MKTLLTSLLLAFGVFLISPAPAKPNLLIVCANDLGETTNLAAAQPEKLAGMQTLLERLIVQGRSTPWARRKNDQRVNRYPVSGIRYPVSGIRYPVAAAAKGKGE